ncbi:hypothetical protein CBR_g29371 [Chara braunii]|uniref:DNA repair protein RAD51 homolog 3 n=1 Tax=Chara braunii TaxID=69332 RepID=A0A388JWR2_CHABU|nr:hypothetical protein CBR_g29371 [Chara braunii]|eukprot:GBG62172.1 hypothetical protein CBR_g29371 [Chara braunii]
MDSGSMGAKASDKTAVVNSYSHPRMEVTVLKLPPTLRSKLLGSGFRTVGDLKGISAVQLARDAQLMHEEALQVLKSLPRVSSASGSALAGAQTAFEILQQERAQTMISTMCEEFDTLLAGGICPKAVTEICGMPGIGKTQLGMQLSVSVQTPSELSGADGEALYIDTEGSFMVERLVEMVNGWLEDVRQAAACSKKPEAERAASRLSRDEALANIHYVRVHDHTEQIAVINTLDNFCREHRRVRLVVIDSVTFHFRQDFQDMALRTRLLNEMSMKLMNVSEMRNVAIVLINQVTVKKMGAVGDKRNSAAMIVPALGESWSHACTNRLVLFWMDDGRYAHLYKSPSLKAGMAPFSVTSKGIRSARESRKRPHPDYNE